MRDPPLRGVDQRVEQPQVVLVGEAGSARDHLAGQRHPSPGGTPDARRPTSRAISSVSLYQSVAKTALSAVTDRTLDAGRQLDPLASGLRGSSGLL